MKLEDLPSREYIAQFIRKPDDSLPKPRGKQGVELTAEEIAKIRQLNREGFKPAAISEMTGRHERTIRYYLHNAPKRTFRTIPYAVMRRAGRLFRAGGTIAEVARILGRTRESVKHIRRRLKLEGGRRERPHR